MVKSSPSLTSSNELSASNYTSDALDINSRQHDAEPLGIGRQDGVVTVFHNNGGARNAQFSFTTTQQHGKCQVTEDHQSYLCIHRF